MCCSSCSYWNLTPAQSSRYHARLARFHARRSRMFADRAVAGAARAGRWLRWSLVLWLVAFVLMIWPALE